MCLLSTSGVPASVCARLPAPTYTWIFLVNSVLSKSTEELTPSQTHSSSSGEWEEEGDGAVSVLQFPEAEGHSPEAAAL